MRNFFCEIGVIFFIIVFILLGIFIPTNSDVEVNDGFVRISISETSRVEGDIYVFLYNRSGALISVFLEENKGYMVEKKLDLGEYWVHEVSNVFYETEGFTLKDEYFELTKDNPYVSIVLDIQYSAPLKEEVIEKFEEDIVEIDNSNNITEDDIEDFIEEVETEVADEKIEEDLEDIVEVEIIEQSKEEVVESEKSETVEVETVETVELEVVEEVKELIYPLIYKDSTSTITVYKEWYKYAWCYIAHLEFSDYNRLGTYCANGKYNNGYQKTSSVAKDIGAILCVNGCYSAPYLNYIVVRDGVICNGADRNLCLPAVYSKKIGLFLNAWEVGIVEELKGRKVQDLVNEGLVTDTFCFGPPMLVDGLVSNSSDTSRAQRTFIGTNGNKGDIWIVVSDGRYNDGESAGLTYVECGNLLASKGCTFGVCLDGGGSSTMVFQGDILNANSKNERAVVDFVYFK